MNQESMKLVLLIEQGSKAIPYPEDNENGRTNRGFKDLKSCPDAIDSIVEAHDCAAFRDALVVINAPETPYFTVGCERALNEGDGVFWKSGYLEFAFNYAELVSDATHYFPLFFHFNQAEPLVEFIKKHQVQFAWELQKCRFNKVGVRGFTCAVWISTGGFPTAAECENVWDEAVYHLSAFLTAGKVTVPSSPPIYEPKLNAAAK